jgi:Zn-dependent peptidase ImmA (M78 family)/DNA-binding XRE family transcriptional regulator
MNNYIFSKRIKSAWLLKGYSQRELADRIGGALSHNAIAKYEKGLMLPNSTALLQLSNALGIKADYFFMPYTVEIEKIEFRKHNKLSVKEENSIKEEVFEKVAKYIELEQLLEIPFNFSNKIEDVIIGNGDDVEKAVEQLIVDWNIGNNAIPNVIQLLEDKGVKVILQKADHKFDGLSGFANGTTPVIVVNSAFSVERMRFTALHELGHLLLNFAPGLEHKEKERLCHRFAGAMLMPRETFLKEMGNTRNRISVSELIGLKEIYGISIQAIMARALALGVISESRFISFRLWINEKEERKKEEGLGSFRGIEESHRFHQLLYRATSEEIISLSKAANLAGKKLAQFRDEFIAI